MAVDHVKSASVTALDTVPLAHITAGEGQPGYAQVVSDYVTAVASSSADATYRVLRVPTNAKMKSLIFASEAQGAGKFDVGVYRPVSAEYPDLAANAVDQDFFATVIDCASAVLPTEIINESGTNTMAKRNMPLWEALGLSSDPRGFFDIVLTVKTTAVTTGTGKVDLTATFVA